VSFLPAGPYSCAACGRPYALENPSGLCPECRLTRQQPGHPLAKQEREALIAELGMPDEARLCWKRLRLRGAIFGPRYRGYELELFGMTVPPPPTWPPPWPFWRLGVPSGAGPGITVQIWQQIVRFEGCPLWGEVRWHPERGERVTIHGLEQRHTKDDLKRVHLGLRLLREAVRGGGRPPGTGTFAGRDEFLVALAEAIRALRQNRRLVTQETVADYFTETLPSRRQEDPEPLFSDRTLRYWLDKFNLTWDEALELAQKIPPSEFTS